MQLTKATSDQVAQLFHMAYHHEQMEGDEHQRRQLCQFAADQGLTHLLPEHAHGTLHEMGIPHKHEGMPEDHVHTVTKAYNPIAKDMEVVKAWADGDTAYVEGWIAPNTKDREKDIVEPEAFKVAIDSYFSRSAPVSSNHDVTHYPVGHVQKGALVRNGKIFKECSHPTDPAEFQYFPQSGTGFYGRVVVNNPEAANAVRKGNLGGFSWIGNANKWDSPPGVRYRYTNISDLMEVTVAAYPINTDAVHRICKAYGLQEENTVSLEDMFKEFLAKQEAQNVQKGGVSEDKLVELINGAMERLSAKVDEKLTAHEQKVQKALENVEATTLQRNQGVGRKAPTSGDQASGGENESPVALAIKKASSGEELTWAEQRAIAEITRVGLTAGMAADPTGPATLTWLD